MRTNETPTPLLVDARRVLLLVAAIATAAGCAVAHGSSPETRQDEVVVTPAAQVDAEVVSCTDAPTDSVCSAWARFLR